MVGRRAGNQTPELFMGPTLQSQSPRIPGKVPGALGPRETPTSRALEMETGRPDLALDFKSVPLDTFKHTRGRLSAADRTALPAPGPDWSGLAGLQESLRGAPAGTNRGGFFVEDEQRLQAWVNVLTTKAVSPARCGSLEAGDGALRRRLRCFPDDVLVPCFLFDANHTLDLASKQLKRAAGTERLGGERKESWPAAGFLGPVVLFAVGFIAQNTIDLVDNGRRQFGKDLCVTRTNENSTQTGPGIRLQPKVDGGQAAFYSRRFGAERKPALAYTLPLKLQSVLESSGRHKLQTAGPEA